VSSSTNTKSSTETESVSDPSEEEGEKWRIQKPETEKTK